MGTSKFVIFIFLLIGYSLAAITPEVRQNITKKIDEITAKIAADINAKHMGTAADADVLHQTLSQLINGLVGKIEDKIEAKDALKAALKPAARDLKVDNNDPDKTFQTILASLKDAYASKLKDIKNGPKKPTKAPAPEPKPEEPSKPNSKVDEEEELGDKETIEEILEKIDAQVEKKKAEAEAKKQEKLEEFEKFKANSQAIEAKLEEAMKKKMSDAKNVWSEISSLVGAVAEELATRAKSQKDKAKAAFEEMISNMEKMKEAHKVSHEMKKAIAAPVINVEPPKEPEAPEPATPAGASVPQVRATFLDRITGTSAWQTTTWILLAVCILLAIALIVVAINQMRQRNEYQRLSGNDQDFVPTMEPVAVYPELKQTDNRSTAGGPRGGVQAF